MPLVPAPVTATVVILVEAPPEPPTLLHTWVGMANIPLSPPEAKHGVLRKSIRLTDGRKTEILEAMCRGCRRNYEDVADQDCEALVDNTHLIGGNPGERKKRKPRPVVDPALIMPGPRINRRGIEAYVRGEV